MTTLTIPKTNYPLVTDRLGELEHQAMSILRYAKERWQNVAVMWSTGKDSTTVLYLLRKLFGCVPFSVIHLDTLRKPPEVYQFRDRIAKEWKLPLCISRNEEAILAGVNPDMGRYKCCSEHKTNNLKKLVVARKFDALILTIRHDEHEVRGMEQLLSFRDESGNWNFWDRYDSFEPLNPNAEGVSHYRVHPLLNWTEEDVWRYIRAKHIPFNPLYLPQEGKRYRSIGCYCCSEPVESTAEGIDEIIREVHLSKGREREGRMQDKEDIHTMLDLRALGYM